MNRIKESAIRFFKISGITLLCFIIGVFAVNFTVMLSTNSSITNIRQMDDIDDTYETAVILGCAVYGNRPSPMLKERLDAGILLYREKKVKKLLMSGDNVHEYYNEIDVMRDYAMEHGVLEGDILIDRLGLSTYESMHRTKELFKLDKFIVISQKYHLHRALYISHAMQAKSIGVSCDMTTYRGQLFREIREVLARNKDFIKSMIEKNEIRRFLK